MEDVDPDMNQRSSAMTARRNTRLVVRSGRIGVGLFDPWDARRESLKRSAGGAKRDIVPVPVLDLIQ